MRSFHSPRFYHCFVAAVLLLCSLGFAENAPPPRISKETREELVHNFSQDVVYIRTNFPMGKVGLKLKQGALSPSGVELQHLMALWGPAAKPGDQALISDVVIKGDYIRFEINGGPVRKQKWYKHIQIEGSNQTITPGDASANARGSFVDLYFDKYVPEMTGPELKQLLRPVFDFDSKTPLEAYLDTVTPQIRDAIKSHHVLVGMNREMVIYAKGRAPKKVREHADEVEYEEWIYGTPPEDVDFVRFVGDEVVRVETMKVDGQKIVRVDKEVDLNTPTVAKKQEDRPSTAPTLRRPGEEMPDAKPGNPSGNGPIAPQPPPATNDPNPNWNASPTPASS